ncbi:hypothetical protein EDD57_12119 [Baia soyae]|uniref:Uncharacterized protein n=1 Tax=Baia soyae TaxID=1544746 RepID=A0A4R2RUU1_9BACL|nr:hypothetical protein EDD57_12119 [Baia soyae]
MELVMEPGDKDKDLDDMAPGDKDKVDDEDKVHTEDVVA